MQAIILAAGMGKRLKELTKDNTKCMVKINGVTLIERMLCQLDKKNLERIIIVTGYKGEGLREYICSLDISTEIIYVDNPVFDKTNNIYSLSLASDYLLEDDTLLFESDIIFEEKVLDSLISDPRDTLALVDRYQPWMDGTCLRLDGQDRITEFISGKNFDFKDTAGCYKTVNIYKFSRHFSETHYVPFLKAYIKALGENEYYEQVLKVIAVLDDAGIRGKRLEGEKWYEVDDSQDLDIASVMFSPGGDAVSRLESRYGGYWRFPGLMDFCYLVNPYYPPQKLVEEMLASFARLLTEYPSGMAVNSLLAGKNFGVRQENIVAGNGAAELIKSFMHMASGNIGVIRPTFEEYPNRYKRAETIVFTPEKDGFRYSADELIEFYRDKSLSTLLLINPDNPSGNYITKGEVLRLAGWCRDAGIKFLVDESFADFADEPDNTLISQEILDTNPGMYVIKSISKSYGVPGLRLGVLASGDVETVKAIKSDVAIWNINSFAEFYMQIAEKYKKEYMAALELFRKERNRFFVELGKISFLRVLPSQANYFMAEVTGGLAAREVTRRLLAGHGILVKDLTAKIPGREFIRISVKKREENDRLLLALRGIHETV